MLPYGRLHEVGRADLVGKYVGWTAKLVQEAFRKAKGSVLFIDEAYSLADGRGLYGDEAINTIVQEMENARGSTVVIFAGYPDKMEQFLNRTLACAPASPSMYPSTTTRRSSWWTSHGCWRKKRS